MAFLGIRIINLVCAVGACVTAGDMLFKRIGLDRLVSQPTVAIVTVVLIYSLLIAVPVSTLFALSGKAGKVLLWFALVLNAFIILYWTMNAVMTYLWVPRAFYASWLGTLVLFVPALINIWALRALLKGMRAAPLVSAEN